MIPLLVEIEYQAGHDERLATARCHVKQEMQGIAFIGEIVFLAMEKTRKGFSLIVPQFIFGVQI